MFGADAPAHTWQMTFLHANLANPAPGFVMADIPGELWSMGTGVNNPAPPKKPGKGGGGQRRRRRRQRQRRRRGRQRRGRRAAAGRPLTSDPPPGTGEWDQLRPVRADFAGLTWG